MNASQQVQAWAEAVAAATQNVHPDDVRIAAEGGWLEDSKFAPVAECIVEPFNHCAHDMALASAYSEWMESDIGNWAQWIKTTLGEDWGKVAHIVAVEGY